MDVNFFKLFTVLHFIAGSYGKTIENIFVSGCSGEEISLKCPSNHKIAIKRLFYGVKEDRKCGKKGRKYLDDCCQRTHGDCIVMNEKDYGKLNFHCSGFDHCSYKVSTLSAEDVCQNMSHSYTDYMTIIYDCVPDNDIVKFCTAGEVTAKSVYLSNEKYPYSETSPDNSSCQCTIRSGLSEGISIYAVDIMLIDEEKRCYHQFRIQDTYGIYRQITCGQEGLYGYRSVYERMVSNVTMTLQIGSKGRCFVWTQITVQKPEDYLVVSCKDDPTIIDESNNQNNRDHKNETLPVVVNQGQDEPPNLISDMVAIIAGICGASAVIIVICIVAIAVHCTQIRERRRPKAAGSEISSPMLAAKKYDGEKETERFQYDEDRYCSIKRNPIKMTKYTDLEAEKDKKVMEAFLEGAQSEEKLPNGNPNRSESPELPYIIDPPESYQSMGDDRYFTMNPQKPQTEVAEIRVTSSLPHRGKKTKNKEKTVTFSPVAMVTPFPYGSDESIGSNGEKNIANIIDSYQNLHTKTASPDMSKFRKVVILPPTEEDVEPPPYQYPNQKEMAEVEALWKNISDTTTMDEGAYDNIDYLLSQNKAKENQNKVESGV